MNQPMGSAHADRLLLISQLFNGVLQSILPRSLLC